MIRDWMARHRSTIFHWGMEVVIVVIGILIAFALQGWAEDVGSARRGAEAERRIRMEVIDNASDFVERVAIYPCLRARIEEFRRGLTAGGPDWRPPAISQSLPQFVFPTVYPVPTRTSTSDAYKGALAEGDLASVTLDRRMDYTRFYRTSTLLDGLNHEENMLADQLQALQLAGRSTPEERRATFAAVARLDTINGLARLVSDQFLRRMREIGLRLTHDEIAYMRRTEWPSRVAYGRGRYGPCWNADAIGALEPAVLAAPSGGVDSAEH